MTFPSYGNPGGAGDRTAMIALTATAGLLDSGFPLGRIVDGVIPAGGALQDLMYTTSGVYQKSSNDVWADVELFGGGGGTGGGCNQYGGPRAGDGTDGTATTFKGLVAGGGKRSTGALYPTNDSVRGGASSASGGDENEPGGLGGFAHGVGWPIPGEAPCGGAGGVFVGSAFQGAPAVGRRGKGGDGGSPASVNGQPGQAPGGGAGGASGNNASAGASAGGRVKKTYDAATLLASEPVTVGQSGQGGAPVGAGAGFGAAGGAARAYIAERSKVAPTNSIKFNPGVNVANASVTFDFGAGNAYVITEAKWYQESTVLQGTWKWQGSNTGAGWDDIGSPFALGGALLQVHSQLAGNRIAYRYYRLLGVSGTTATPTIFDHEIEFKIGTEPVPVLVIVPSELRVCKNAGQWIAQRPDGTLIPINPATYGIPEALAFLKQSGYPLTIHGLGRAEPFTFNGTIVVPPISRIGVTWRNCYLQFNNGGADGILLDCLHLGADWDMRGCQTWYNGTGCAIRLAPRTYDPTETLMWSMFGHHDFGFVASNGGSPEALLAMDPRYGSDPNDQTKVSNIAENWFKGHLWGGGFARACFKIYRPTVTGQVCGENVFDFHCESASEAEFDIGDESGSILNYNVGTNHYHGNIAHTEGNPAGRCIKTAAPWDFWDPMLSINVYNPGPTAAVRFRQTCGVNQITMRTRQMVLPAGCSQYENLPGSNNSVQFG